MKIFGNKNTCNNQCEELKNILKNCCNQTPNITCNDQIHFKVKCSKCGKIVESISPTEILLKWNGFFKK